MAEHAQLVEEIQKAVQRHIDAIEADGELSDKEADEIIQDVMQKIEDKYMDLLEKFGIEVGDERVD
jgi:polyhydroxyalkanoate synthesis regulator phasin